jgi:hypothetical protein
MRIRVGPTLAALAWLCSFPAVADPSAPPSLSAGTSARVVAHRCSPGAPTTKSSFNIEDRNEVAALLGEFAALRSHPSVVVAAKFSCSTDVTFVHEGKVLATVYVFPCEMLERAPVEGKRYFRYKEGLNRLPNLMRLVGGQAKQCE